jgi:hypothetical protein
MYSDINYGLDPLRFLRLFAATNSGWETPANREEFSHRERREEAAKRFPLSAFLRSLCGKPAVFGLKRS